MFLNPNGYLQNISILYDKFHIWFSAEDMFELFNIETLPEENIAGYGKYIRYDNIPIHHDGLCEFVKWPLPTFLRGIFHVQYKEFTFFGVVNAENRIFFRSSDVYKFLNSDGIEGFIPSIKVFKLIDDECFHIWLLQTLDNFWNPPMIKQSCKTTQVILFKMDKEQYRIAKWEHIYMIKNLNRMKKIHPHCIEVFRRNNVKYFMLHDLKIAMSKVFYKTGKSNVFYSKLPEKEIVQCLTAYLNKL